MSCLRTQFYCGYLLCQMFEDIKDNTKKKTRNITEGDEYLRLCSVTVITNSLNAACLEYAQKVLESGIIEVCQKKFSKEMSIIICNMV